MLRSHSGSKIVKSSFWSNGWSLVVAKGSSKKPPCVRDGLLGDPHPLLNVIELHVIEWADCSNESVWSIKVAHPPAPVINSHDSSNIITTEIQMDAQEA